MKLIVILFHVVACVALILIVLLQKGKGASMGAAFGGSSQTIFGSTGAAPFLSKLTAAAAVLFMVTSLLLALMLGKGSTSSVMKGVGGPEVPAAQQTQSAPPPPAENK
jgi:preprotein translocase subunit SecG